MLIVLVFVVIIKSVVIVVGAIFHVVVGHLTLLSKDRLATALISGRVVLVLDLVESSSSFRFCSRAIAAAVVAIITVRLSELVKQGVCRSSDSCIGSVV